MPHRANQENNGNRIHKDCGQSWIEETGSSVVDRVHSDYRARIDIWTVEIYSKSVSKSGFVDELNLRELWLLNRQRISYFLWRLGDLLWGYRRRHETNQGYLWEFPLKLWYRSKRLCALFHYSFWPWRASVIDGAGIGLEIIISYPFPCPYSDKDSNDHVRKGWRWVSFYPNKIEVLGSARLFRTKRSFHFWVRPRHNYDDCLITEEP
jgi:hypothetical protein